MQARLQQLLTERRVRFQTIPHLRAFTAQETAESAHIPGQDLAKTVMAKLDGKLAMIVVPATRRIDFERLRRMTGAAGAELAHEDEFRDLFPDCEIGAMPPFGNLWGLPVYVDHMLAQHEHLVFNGGDHVELVKLSWNDFVRLVHPRVIALDEGGVH